jgi:hypothetical protein
VNKWRIVKLKHDEVRGVWVAKVVAAKDEDTYLQRRAPVVVHTWTGPLSGIKKILKKNYGIKV